MGKLALHQRKTIKNSKNGDGWEVYFGPLPCTLHWVSPYRRKNQNTSQASGSAALAMAMGMSSSEDGSKSAWRVVSQPCRVGSWKKRLKRHGTASILGSAQKRLCSGFSSTQESILENKDAPTWHHRKKREDSGFQKPATCCQSNQIQSFFLKLAATCFTESQTEPSPFHIPISPLFAFHVQPPTTRTSLRQQKI